MGPRPHLWFLHSKQRLLHQNTSLYGNQTSPVVSCMHNSVIRIKITSLYGFHPSSVVLYIQNSAFRTWIPCLYVSQPLSMVLCIQKSDIRTTITCLYGSHTSPVILCMQNNFKSRSFQSKNYRWRLVTIETSKSGARHAVLQAQNHRIISLYDSQTSPVVLCMQNSAISIRITSVNQSLPSSVVFGCKTATFGPQYQVSIGPRHKLSFCACKTAWFAPQLLVSIGPSTLLLFMYTKQRLFDQKKKKSLWAPDLNCLFVHAQQRD